jgi:hypothetical protein
MCFFCHLLNSPEFLVYRRSKESIQDYVPIGTPYKTPIYCLAINYPSQRLPTGENMIAEIPWSSYSDNKLLSIGDYFVRSDFELEIDGHRRIWTMKLDFQLQ